MSDPHQESQAQASSSDAPQLAPDAADAEDLDIEESDAENVRGGLLSDGQVKRVDGRWMPAG